jgi:DNA modification methylase
MIYHSENLAKVYAGDCRHMTDIPDDSVHCVVTSPPYYGLRRYKGLEDLVWGGREDCQHEWSKDKIIKRGHPGNLSTLVGTQTATLSKEAGNQGAYCQLCGAWRGQLGSEPTIEMFIAHTVEVCREVKRVLRPDGIFWLNIGDSMAGSGSPGGDYRDGKGGDDYLRAYNRKGDGLKPLDACLIPFRLALALQADGWWIRSDIIWAKNNPMPESLQSWRWEKHKVKQCPQCKALDSFKNQKCQKCGYSNKENRGTEPSRNTTDNRPQQDHDGKDFKQSVTWEDCPGCPKCLPNDGLVLRQGSWRPTNAHEYIFMLTKTDNYYADREGVKEVQTGNAHSRGTEACNMPYQEARGSYKDFNTPAVDVGGRNLRSVWNFSTQGFKDAHFATFPPELPLRCIKASTSEVGVCSKCGKQWSRVIGSSESIPTGHGTGKKMIDVIEEQRGETSLRNSIFSTGCVSSAQTLGWRPSCKCNAPSAPAIVLDPFAGSGTTLAVAKSLGHIGIGYELSTEYLPMIKERLEATPEGELKNQLVLI